MRQTCILIVGMHRSGTSALTGVLNILDIYLSNTIEGDDNNKKGYFESSVLNNFNNILLSNINSSWDDVFFEEEKLIHIKDEEFNELKSKIKKEFEFSNLFAIKDPRIAFLFPVYKRALEELNIDIKIIIPYRNPVEVANSLNRRNNFSYEKGMLLWSHHFLLIEMFSRNFERVFINFNELMSNPRDTLTLISEKLNIEFQSKYIKKRKQINAFLEPNLKHYNLSINNLSENTPKIIRDILEIKDEFNDNIIYSKFDRLRGEFSNYKKFFYNQDIIRIFSELYVLKNNYSEIEKINEQSHKQYNEIEKKLAQSQLQYNEIEKKLEQSDQKYSETKKKLEQSEQKYSEIKKKLEQSDQKYSETEKKLEQREQKYCELDKKLMQSDQKHSKTEKKLMQSDQKHSKTEKKLEQSQWQYKDINQRLKKNIQQQDQMRCQFSVKERTLLHKNQEINALKGELVAVYTSKSWVITRLFRKMTKTVVLK